MLGSQIFIRDVRLSRNLFIRDGDKNAEHQALQRLASFGGTQGILKMVQTEATVSVCLH